MTGASAGSRNRSLAAAISSRTRSHASVDSVRRRGRCPTPVVNPSFHCRRLSSIDMNNRPPTVAVHSTCWVVTVMTRLLSGFGHPQMEPNSRDPLSRPQIPAPCISSSDYSVVGALSSALHDELAHRVIHDRIATPALRDVSELGL